MKPEGILSLLCRVRRRIRLSRVGGFEDPTLRDVVWQQPRRRSFNTCLKDRYLWRESSVSPRAWCRNASAYSPTFTLRFNPLPFNTARPPRPFTSTGSTCCTALHRPATPRNDRAMPQVPSWVEPFRLQISHQMVSTSLEESFDDLHFL